MESCGWLHRERVGDLGLVRRGLYRHGEATDACGSVEPTQVLSVRALIEWPTKVVHVGGSCAQSFTQGTILSTHNCLNARP